MSFFSVLGLSWRLLLRDWRSGEIRVLALALTVAVAAVAAVGFFTDRVHRALEQESHQLLGADLLLVSDAPWAQDIITEANTRQLQLAQTMSFPSMVSGGGKAQLADIKGVSPGYPLRGRLRIARGDFAGGQEVDGIPFSGRAWADERLLLTLGLRAGDKVQLGQRQLVLDAILTLEPDRGSNFLGVAPRLMVNLDDIPATGLIQPGARITYRLLVAGQEGAVASFKQWLEPRLARGQRLEDTSNARPEIRSALERAERFLGLSSLLSVILAVVVVILAARRYVDRHLDACAVMRCMGSSQGQLLRLHLGKLVWLGILVGCVGCALGFAAHFVLNGLLSQFVGTPLPVPSALPWVQGLALALLLLLGFVGPPVLRLSRVPTLRVLRRELGQTQPTAQLAYGLGVCSLVGLMFWVAGDFRLGAYVAGGFSLALVVFVVLARGVLHLLTFRLKVSGWGYARGLLALRQRPWASSLQIVALGLGLLAMVLLTITRGELMTAWEASVPPDAPNRFLVNVQPDQRQAVSDFMAAGGVAVGLAPSIRGRLLSIDGQSVSATSYPDNDRAQRLVEREFNLSWAEQLPPGNLQTAGRWFQVGEAGVASVEEGLAKDLGIKVGSRLIFNVAGEPVPVRVVGLRKLNWDSMRVNFFVLTSRADLQDQPASYISSFHLPQDKSGLVMALVQQFPNLTLIDITSILGQLRQVLGQVSQAIQFVFVFVLATSLIVLYSALVSSFAERRYELALLRALGASREQLQKSLLAEVALIGALAGLFAGAGAMILGRVVALQLFKLDAPWNFLLLPMLALLGAGLALAVAWWSVRKLLAISPLGVIRADA